MRVAVNVEQCWHAVPGGTGRVTVDLLAALGRHAPEVEIVGVAAAHRGPAPDAYQPPVPVAHSRLPQKALYEAWHGLRRPRIESIAESDSGALDVAVGLGGATPPTALPLAVTIHDLGFLHFPDFYTRHGVRFLERGLELIRRDAAIVPVVSKSTFDDCVAHGFEPERLRVIPWGVEIPEVSDDDIATARRQTGVEGRYLVAVGTLEPRKNLRRLLSAWDEVRRAHDDLTLVIVGPKGWGDEMESAAESVVVTGFVDHDVRNALYAGAELSVYPSLLEGFGLPVLESMAVGTPVVTSMGTSTEELVADGGGVAVDPTDTDAIAGAIDRLLGDDDARGALAASGEKVAHTYSWARCAEAYAAAWAEAAA